MKRAEIPEISRRRPQFIKTSSGLKNIPPPTPTIPESRPSAAPIASPVSQCGAVGSLINCAVIVWGSAASACGSVGAAAVRARTGTTSRKAAKSSTNPISGLNIWGGSVSPPPINAIGTEPSANGRNTRREKYPARKKRTVAMEETTMLRVSAIGFISAGSTPSSAIAA